MSFFVFFMYFCRMIVKTEAIVLHSFKLGESKIVAELFCRATGRLTVVAPLPKTAKGRMKKQFFQPLTLLDVECDVRPRLNMQRLKDIRLLAPYASLPFEPAKLAIALFVAEFLLHALRSEQQNEALFEYIKDSLLWLDNCQSHYANFHLVFLMRLSRFLGFFPNLDDYREGCCFDLRQACFVAAAPVHSYFLPPREASLIPLMMRMNFANMHLFRLSHHERGRLIDVIVAYYQVHLPAFPELRSLPVLKELW